MINTCFWLSSLPLSKARIFLLVDLQEFIFSDLGSRGRKDKKKSSENDQPVD